MTLQKNKLKQVRIVTGTGRCGTTSASRFFSSQPDSWFSHELENDPFIQENTQQNLPAWGTDWDTVREALYRIIEQTGEISFVGDVAMWYLPYVPQIIVEFPEVKILCLKRSRKQVMQSYMRATPGRDRWRTEDIQGWNHVYPKYFDAKTKAESIGRYWDDFYTQAESYESQYPTYFKIIPTQALNSKNGMNYMLSFFGYPEKNRATSAVFHENAIDMRVYLKDCMMQGVYGIKNTIRKIIGSERYDALKEFYYGIRNKQFV